MKVFIWFCRLSIIAFAALIAYLFSPGSYVKSERYYLVDLNVDQAISRVKKLKEKYPKYKPFTISDDGAQKEMVDEVSNDFFTSFYLEEEMVTILCIVTIPQNRDNTKPPATIILHAIRWDTDPKQKWKWMNTEDMNEDEKNKSKIIKRKFETEVLSKLGEWR